MDKNQRNTTILMCVIALMIIIYHFYRPHAYHIGATRTVATPYVYKGCPANQPLKKLVERNYVCADGKKLPLTIYSCGREKLVAKTEKGDFGQMEFERPNTGSDEGLFYHNDTHQLSRIRDSLILYKKDGRTRITSCTARIGKTL